MGKVMRHTLGASLNIRHNLSSSKGPKPLQLKLLTTYIPKTSAFTLAFSTSQRLRTTRASARTFFTLDRKSGSAGMPRPISYAVFCLKNKMCRLIGEKEGSEAVSGTDMFTLLKRNPPIAQ